MVSTSGFCVLCTGDSLSRDSLCAFENKNVVEVQKECLCVLLASKYSQSTTPLRQLFGITEFIFLFFAYVITTFQ